MCFVAYSSQPVVPLEGVVYLIGEVFSSLLDPASIYGCCCYGFEATSISTYCSAPPSGAYGPTLSYIILSFHADGAVAAVAGCWVMIRFACWTD